MILTAPNVSDAAWIGAFLGNGRLDRWEQVFARSKGRKKFLDALHHEKDIDPRCMTPIPHLERFAATVYSSLVKLGAPEICHVISAYPELDGKNLPLLAALEEVVDARTGTIICCVPGKLAYYFSEERNGQYILRPPNTVGSHR